MTQQRTWNVNVRDDLPVAHEELGGFATQVNEFIEARQIDFFNRVNARMTGVGSKQIQAMFDSAERALKDVEPQLEGKNAGERDSIQINALQKIFASREIAFSARQYYKLGKLKAALPALEECFNTQFEQLVAGRPLSPHGKSIASGIAQELALDEIKSLYPEREGVRDLDLYRNLGRVSRELTSLLTEYAGPKNGRAVNDIQHFNGAIMDATRELAGFPQIQRTR